MLALQASIGALNDRMDAGRDAGRKPGKPIPAGRVSPSLAAVVGGLGLLVGLALSAPSGGPTLVAAVAGVSCGYAYDLGLSRTSLSWLPLALGLPLVPIHAWLGATGGLPPRALEILLIGILGGAGLALANGLVDRERDLSANRPTVVVQLGTRRAWLAHVAAIGAAVTVVLVAGPGGSGSGTPGAATLGITAGIGVLIIGAGLLGARSATVRERGWELEAVGIALLGISWLAELAGTAL
jgi:4-hydroxybenzoate polyprenyltransferase